MSVIQKLTLIGMYNYDDTLFDQISFPEGVDRDLFVNSLLLEKGEQPVLYASLTFNKSAFGVWSLKWYHSIERLLKAFTEEYNPLHNFDRNEDYSDTETRTNTNTETRTNSNTENGFDETTGSSNVNRTGNSDTNETSSDNTENTVSAYNSDMYQPDTNTAASGTRDTGTDYSEHTGTTDSQKVTSTRTGSANENMSGNENENRSLIHKAHLYGNIGVTKSQEMLLDELDLRSKHNLYDAIIEIFANEFLISIY